MGKGQLFEGGGKPWVSGGSPPKQVERMQLLIDVCNTTQHAFEKEAASADIRVEGVSYSSAQKSFDWHSPSDTRQLIAKDIIDNEQHDSLVKEWAKELMSSFSRSDGEEVGLVGLGTGAYIAFAIARLLVEEKNYVPAGLWLVNSPLRLPWACTASPGVLKDCPLWTMVD